MTGESGPLSWAEFVEWQAFTHVHNEREKAELEKATKRGSG